MADETVTLEIASEGGESDELTVPAVVLDMLREEGDSDPEIIGDIAMLGLAQRIHGAIHHAQGEPSQQIKDAEDVTNELFEERFGQSFGEMTGHQH
ncbi:MAG: hypothetical protein ABEJ31_12430 [Haloarculaceae archaeon]